MRVRMIAKRYWAEGAPKEEWDWSQLMDCNGMLTQFLSVQPTSRSPWEESRSVENSQNTAMETPSPNNM